jgi:hypothetical protein
MYFYWSISWTYCLQSHSSNICWCLKLKEVWDLESKSKKGVKSHLYPLYPNVCIHFTSTFISEPKDTAREYKTFTFDSYWNLWNRICTKSFHNHSLTFFNRLSTALLYISWRHLDRSWTGTLYSVIRVYKSRYFSHTLTVFNIIFIALTKETFYNLLPILHSFIPSFIFLSSSLHHQITSQRLGPYSIYTDWFTWSYQTSYIH